MTIERLLHDPALHTLAAPVNQSDLAQAGFVCCRHVLLDNRRHVAWCERMEVDRGLDRNSHFSIVARGTASQIRHRL